MPPSPAESELRLDHAVVEQVRQLESVRPGLLRRLVDVFERNAVQFFDGLDAQLAAGDTDALRIGFHSLKGTAASLGALRLSRLAMLTERACGDSGERTALLQLAHALRIEFAAVRVELTRAAGDGSGNA